MTKLITFGKTAAVAAIGAALALGITAGFMSGSPAAPPPAQAATPAVETGSNGMVTSFAAIVKRDQPAVVNISSSKVIRQAESNQFSQMDPFFRRFFGDNFPGGSRVPKERLERGLGSGVIVRADGYVLTNNHVVDGADEIEVTLSDKRNFKAKVIGTDPKTDIAVVKIEANNLPTIALADSSKVRVGDIVLALGNPFGVGQTVTMGIVSATGRANLGIEDYEDFIQTDAAINPGNSGGALVNTNGELIGINTAIISRAGGSQGIGFAVPVNLARIVMDQIMKNGKVTRAWLGVMLQEVTPSIAKAFHLDSAKGALVGDVLANSPAAGAGLQKGDILVSLNGKPITDVHHLRLGISMMKPGTMLKLGVFRDGAIKDITVKLGELPADSWKPGENGAAQGNALDGLSIDELTPDIIRQLQLPADTKGVVVSDVDPISPAGQAGLRRGDVIEGVNRQPVQNVADFRRLAREAQGGPILLLVNRGGTTLFLVIEPHQGK